MQGNFTCHNCKISFINQPESLECLSCGKKYSIIDDIPVFISGLNLSKEQIRNINVTDKFLTSRAGKNKLIFSREHYQQLFRTIIRLFGRDVKFNRVLDLGCGNGFLSLNLLKYGNFAKEIYGLDVSLDALKDFRNNIQANKIDSDIFLSCSTAEKTFLSDDYFDAVICRSFIHHIPLEPVLEEVQRVLKKGGVFICFNEPYLNYSVTIFKKSWNTLINLYSFFYRKLKNKNYNSSIINRSGTKKFLYSQKTIENIAKKKGFNVFVFNFFGVLLPFAKIIIYPFSLKFPRFSKKFDYLLKLIQEIDSRVMEKVLPKRCFQSVSFYLKKT